MDPRFRGDDDGGGLCVAVKGVLRRYMGAVAAIRAAQTHCGWNTHIPNKLRHINKHPNAS